MKKDRLKASEKNPLELVDEAFEFLRSSSSSLLVRYYVGTIPFLIGFLYFWAAMSYSAFAWQWLLPGSFLTATLFLWMKYHQALFMRAIHRELDPARHREPINRWRVFEFQTLVQPIGLLLLPVSLALLIPAGWTYAWFQHALLIERGRDESVMQALGRASAAARLWSFQNHIVLLLFSLLAIPILIALAVITFQIPQVIKTLFGIESVFTLSGIHMLNTTFLVSIPAFTYLLIDPVIKTCYALRTYYGESIRTGTDLRGALARLGMLLAVTAAIGGFGAGARAEDRTLSEENVRQAIEEARQDAKYSWRMPREAPPIDEERGLLTRWALAVAEWFRDGLRFIGKVIGEIIDWILSAAPRPKVSTSHRDWKETRLVLLSTLAALLIAIGLAVGYRSWSALRRNARAKAVAASAVTEPDLTRDEVLPSALPEDEWFALAKRLRADGNRRLSLRAIYLGLLAGLAARRWITVATSRTNREYERELRRRAADRPGLIEIFTRSRATFEPCWYGEHEVSEAMLDGAERDFLEVHRHAAPH